MIRRVSVVVGLGIFLGLAWFGGIVAAQEATEKTGLADVEVVLRAPDGKLLDTKAVRIEIPEQNNPTQAGVKATTDSQGVARFRVGAGRFRLSIKVPGVGYAATGVLELRPGTVMHLELPPLAGFGSLDGTVPRNVCTGAVTVGASSPNVGQLKVAADADGHFHFDDVPGGDWFLAAGIGDGFDCMCALGPKVPVTVGKVTGGIVLGALKNPCWRAPKPAPAAATTPAETTPATVTFGHSIKTDSPVVWARGIVRDEEGRPVENANVYALGTYYGGIRMAEATAKATTDAHGYYELKGAGGLSSFSATLVATAPGHPPAWAWPTFPQISWFETDPPQPDPVTQDMVLPSKSGQLHVKVLKQGASLAGASVAVYLENANLRDMWAMGGRSAVREEIDNMAYPAGVTDENGNVHFENLLPGRYRIVALGDKQISEVRGLAAYPQGWRTVPHAIADGIPVSVGKTTEHIIDLYQQEHRVKFQVSRSDGTARQGWVPIQFANEEYGQRASSLSLDAQGNGAWDLETSGLWQVDLMHKESSASGGVRVPDDFRPPYEDAGALFAISPNLGASVVPTIRERHVEAPSAHVVVQDSKGMPVRATVTLLEEPMERISGAGSTDSHGEIVFKELVVGQTYTVRVSGTEMAQVKFVEWPDQSAPLPIAKELATQHVLVDHKFVAHADSRNDVSIRPQAVCYVYGVIRGSGWKETAITHVEPRLDRTMGGLLLRESTGEFVAGPFLAGTAQIYFRPKGQTQDSVVPIEVNGAGDAPVHQDIDLDVYADEAREGEITGAPHAFLGMNGISTQATGANHLSGKVLLPDGVTPAEGAVALYFDAGQSLPSIAAMADALGELHGRGLWRNAEPVSSNTTPLKAPMVVAFLPGERGATIYRGPIRRNRALRLILPPAISVSGTVTIGNGKPGYWPGVIRVVAAHQGEGALDPALSVVTTADAEGHFVLAGLTPGSYQVQAALDNIWLSSVVTLEVRAEKTAPIRLAIPAPGVSVRLELRDRAGKPLIGRAVAIERSGPLAYLWPAQLYSDGDGMVWIPTLEAGRHAVRIDGEPKPRQFRVAALPNKLVVVQISTAL